MERIYVKALFQFREGPEKSTEIRQKLNNAKNYPSSAM